MYGSITPGCKHENHVRDYYPGMQTGHKKPEMQAGLLSEARQAEEEHIAGNTAQKKSASTPFQKEVIFLQPGRARLKGELSRDVQHLKTEHDAPKEKPASDQNARVENTSARIDL